MSDSVRVEIAAAGAKLKSKGDSFLMNVLSFALPWRAWFMGRAWTTLGRTIYAPTTVDLSQGLKAYEAIVRHELVHVEQWKRWWLLMWVGYLLPLLPLPIAYFRWRIERRAYLVNIRAGRSVDDVVNDLWWRYAFCWPRSWMRSWFNANK